MKRRNKNNINIKYNSDEEKINVEKKNHIKNENMNNKKIDNYIIAEINIKDNDIYKNIRIINSYEEYKRNNIYERYKTENENEKEIKEKCEIKINDKIIPFSYYYKFMKVGKYEIKYLFNKNIFKSDYMFYGCKYLSNINLSNFNTINIINMSFMFCR